MAGDYGTFARYLEPGAVEFFRRLEIEPGTCVLDIGCGAGQLALLAARAGAVVTGVDIATNLIEQARAQAEAEGLTARFEEGDAELLPYPDASFDLVASLIGAMFAPRPELVAAEMLRVCRPGGRIAMANWTPGGFAGQMFRTAGQYVPSPAGVPPPVLWGDEATVRERLGTGTTDLQLTRRAYPFRYPFPPAEVVEYFRTYFGPLNRAFAVLDPDGQAGLRRDLEALWSAHNTATDGSTAVDSEYLEVLAYRREG
jgi:SAM-dependent methyltransferase